ncbi:hypothetical protein SUGI_0658320 [Cryptomeria japonica]|nr:hypothetical protein SUGI_0658320 [Cryptomeria japonica]
MEQVRIACRCKKLAWCLTIFMLMQFDLYKATALPIGCSSTVSSMSYVYCQNLPSFMRHRLLPVAPASAPLFSEGVKSIRYETEAEKMNVAIHLEKHEIIERRNAARQHRMKIESAVVGGIITGGLLGTVLVTVLCYVRVTRKHPPLPPLSSSLSPISTP